MTTPRDKVFQAALELEQEDRAELAKLLIDSLDPATDQDAEEAWMREIERRKAEIDAETIPWDVVRTRLRRTRRG
jgi:putative addiction module component (TIGR02574 family)